jgi:hypothetical protein
MKLTVLDNIISTGYQDLVEEIMGGTYFDWYFNSQISVVGGSDTNSGFTHKIFSIENGNPVGTTYYHLIFPILLEALNKYKRGTLLKELYRIRGGMFVKDQTNSPHIPHVDRNDFHYTMLYYVNDSDGPTKIFSGEKIIREINPKKGRVVLMTGDTYHASSSPRTHAKRIVINYNFLI